MLGSKNCSIFLLQCEGGDVGSLQKGNYNETALCTVPSLVIHNKMSGNIQKLCVECVHTGDCSLFSGLCISHRKEVKTASHIKESLKVLMPEHSSEGHKGLVALCTPLTLPGHLQFPAFLHPLQLSGIPTVDREPPRASSDPCNELFTTHADISGISVKSVTHRNVMSSASSL